MFPRSPHRQNSRVVLLQSETVPLPLANPKVRVYVDPPCKEAGRRIDAIAPLRLWHLTSLDAPTVAVVWALAIARTAGAHLPGWVPVMLALGTWTVYIGDRLLDARAGLSTGEVHRLRERHFFHWKYRRVMTPLAVIAGAVAAAMISVLMPAAIRDRNALLGVAALVYFSGVHAPGLRSLRLLPKELVVGVLFTAGCALPTLTRMWLWHGPSTTLRLLLMAVTMLAALAWLNCHAIEQWESGSPRRIDGIMIASATLTCACLTVAAEAGGSATRLAVLMACTATSAALLGVLDASRTRISPTVLRAAADLVLLTPIMCLMR